MRFSLTDELPHDRELVFLTHRDKLVQLVPYLPNVRSVVVQAREERGPVVRLVNVWTAAHTDVPAPVRPLVKPEHLTWVDRATWDLDRWRCDWEIALTALPDAVSARGFNVFHDEGGETVIDMSGAFEIHPEHVPGVPAALARTAAPALEKFVVGLLQPNLRRSNQAVGAYIDDHG